MLREVAAVARLNLRLKAKWIAGWWIGVTVFAYLTPGAYLEHYPTLESRAGFLQSMQTATGAVAMYGRIDDPGTIGQLSAWEAAAWIIVLLSIMSILTVTSLTRLAEDDHTAEIVRATGTGPGVMLTAAWVVTVIIGLVMGAGITGAMLLAARSIGELTTAGALAYGLAVCLAVIGAAIVAVAVSFLVTDAGSLRRWAMLSLAVTFMLRAVADVRDIGVLRWFSPQGWLAVIDPYGSNNMAAGAVCAAVCVAAMAGCVVVDTQREYGRGLLPDRPAAASSRRNLDSLGGLRRVLDRPTAVGWGIGLVILAAFFGSLTGTIDDMLARGDNTAEILGEALAGQDVEAGYAGFCAVFAGIFIAAAGVQIVLRQCREETARLIDLVRASGIARWRPLAATTVSALRAVVLLTLVSGIVFAAAAYSPAHNTRGVLEACLYAFSTQLAPVMLLTGVAVFLVGFNPRLAVVSWIPVGYAAVVAMMGKMFDLPDWMMKLSAFNHLILPDTIDDQWGWNAGMCLIGCALASAGIAWSARREVH
ncbi:hypothetical protein ACFSSC_11090 [Corynebacterium mendelii]|uniref:ABC transporter permease n=1 Tax=Corynebacterium mendelii TaxID=2765362 RepID=A0A939E143_9CORY|nr:hypothetical protein [Corynebacterium mendelii]MBN9644504.1 hypothetical protein [Corynebacterium mendelii]